MSWDRPRNRGRGFENRRQDDRREGGSRPASSGLAQQHKIDPFALFCAYHLGITENDGYKFQNIHHVARRFNTNAAVIKQLLVEYRMDPETIVNSGYDMASAQVDIMVAPEGISRTELARSLFEEFQEAPKQARDWQKELEQDAKENERTFGRR
ncbi:MAG TPA: hypothetical protein VEB21_19075 [Terriglobales bacterium]|nr:hypothetical protein [Terriglobales bacterium]